MASVELVMKVLPIRIVTLALVGAFSLHLTVHSQVRSFHLPAEIGPYGYQEGLVIVRFKEVGTPSDIRGQAVSGSIFDTLSIEPMFPKYHSDVKSRTGNPSLLRYLYRINLPPGTDLIATINQLLQNKNVAYAEPYFKCTLLIQPNDPEADSVNGSQNYLGLLGTYQAWDLEQADSSVLIAILDTGIKPDHEDLQENIYHNLADPVNGLDDDGDGLVDNFSGWDIADGDNDPTADSDGHGTEVSGQSSAATNNGLGIAGIGFDARVLPIKIYRSDNEQFQNGYEAIVMAAEQGADVINLSWGNTGPYQQFVQDIIDFAVQEEDAVIVAAAGNTNAELNFFPASYQHVLSVGASDLSDQKASFGTFSRFIDLMAPGASNYTTKNDGAYGLVSGSSFSAPLVAGAAALVRARFPGLNARQVMEQLRVTADNIYPVGNNQNYFEKLGKGRLNIYRSLTDTLSPAVRMSDFSASNYFGDFAFHDDTVTLSIDLINLLNDVQSLTVEISTASEHATVLNPNWHITSLPTLGQATNGSDPFQVYLDPSLPRPDTISFRLGFAANDYEDYQYFDLITSPDYLEVNNGSMGLTVGGNGNLGYNMDGLIQGNGLTFDQESVLDHIGLILATDSFHVSNNVVKDFTSAFRDHSFATQEPVKLYHNSQAVVDARSSFNDTPEGMQDLGLLVEQKVLAFDSEDFLILNYRIVNVSNDTIFNLLAGVYADWDLGDGLNNRANWVDSIALGFVSDSQNNDLLAGMSVLSTFSPIYYALDNNSLNGNTADLGTTFSKEQKYGLMASGVSQPTAGDVGSGNDVSFLIGGNLDTLPPNQVRTIAFAFLKAPNLSGLIAQQAEALQSLQSYRENPPLYASVVICSGAPDTVDLGPGLFSVYSDAEANFLVYQGNRLPLTPLFSDTVFYLVSQDKPYPGEVMRLHVHPSTPIAEFRARPDTLFLGDGPHDLIEFEDQSTGATTWNWEFSNGFISDLQNPKIPFDSTGTYTAVLRVSNETGCPSSLRTRQVVVASRGAPPQIDDLAVCEGEIASIADQGGGMIRVYQDAQKSTLLFQGLAFQTDALLKDTTFYVTLAGSIESSVREVRVRSNSPESKFTVELDTTNLAVKNSMKTRNTSTGGEAYQWFRDSQLLGEGVEVNFQYDPEVPFDLALVTIDDLGCQDSLVLPVRPSISVSPQSGDIEICPNETIHLSPGPGKLFYFYSDPQLSQLIHKGERLVANDSTLTTVFVTGIDSLKESLPDTVSIIRVALESKFQILPNPLVLSDGDQVRLIDQSVGAQTYSWVINGVHLSTQADTTLAFTIPEDYQIGQIVEGIQGCSDTLYQILRVVEVTGIKSDDTGSIKLYPNPADHRLFLEMSDEWRLPVSVLLTDLTGRPIVFQPRLYQRDLAIDLWSVSDGIYLLQVHNPWRQFRTRVIVQR